MNKLTLDDRAKEFDWVSEIFPLFSGNLMTTYSRGEEQVQAETNPYGGLVWLARSVRGWVTESWHIDEDSLLCRALEWLSTPIGDLA